MTPDTNFDTWQVHDYKHTCQSIVLQKHDRKPKESVKKSAITQTVLLSLHAILKRHFYTPNTHLINKQTNPLMLKNCRQMIPTKLKSGKPIMN